MHTPNRDPKEETTVIHDPEDIIKETLDSMDAIERSIDGCIDEKGASAHTTTDPIWRKFIECYKRGVKIRFITEITVKNIFYCRRIMQVAELRHLDDVKGNFGIGDGRLYHASTTSKEAQ